MGIISGSFTGATQSSFGVDVEWSAQTDVANNLSKVTVNVFRRYYSIDVGALPCRCRINGVVQEKSIPGVKHYGRDEREHIATFYQDVPHNADGTMPACEIYADFYFNLTTSKGIYIGYMSAGGTVALETIPRASVFTYVQDVIELGSVCLFKWVPASAAFRYQMEFILSGNTAGWTVVIHPNTTEEYQYLDNLVLDHFARWITGNPPELYATVVLHTYSDSAAQNEIGSHSRNLKITVPDNDATKPTFTLSAAPKNTPIEGLYIQGRCGISVGFDSVDCKYGAWIAGYAVTVNGVPYPMDGSQMILASGNAILRGTVTDSRGFSRTVELPIYVHPYRKPRVTGFVCYRCKKKEDGTYEPAEDGTTLYLQATREFDSLGGNNQCRLEYCINNLNGDWTELEAGAYINENTAAVYLEGFEATNSFSVYVRAKDALDWGDHAGKLIPTADVDFHLRHGGKGAAFGGYAQEEDLLDVWWRGRFRKILDMTGNRIQNLEEPEESTDAATKGYANIVGLRAIHEDIDADDHTLPQGIYRLHEKAIANGINNGNMIVLQTVAGPLEIAWWYNGDGLCFRQYWYHVWQRWRNIPIS